MLRRWSPRAALAALAFSALALQLPAPAYADGIGGVGGVGDGGEDPSLVAPPTKATRTPERSRTAASRQAERVEQRAEATPLSVTIDQLTPSTIPEKGPIRVSGTVTNDDTVPWSTINLYPFVSAEPMTTAAELSAAAESDQETFVGNRITDEEVKDVVPELAPGATEPFTLTIPRKALGASTAGVYWFGVHALGDNPDGGRDTLADGRARTFLPLVPPGLADQTSPEQATVVIPLRHQLTYAEDGSVDDLAGWTRTLSSGGRLSSLVGFGASSGAQSVTWVVDPAVVDAVRRLAEGNPGRSLEPNLERGQDDGEAVGEGAASDAADPTATEAPTEDPPATPPPADEDASPLDLDELDPVVQAATQAAQEWLQRLGAAMRAEDQVLSLPYGDVDVAGAAVNDPALLQRAVARAGTSLPGFDVTTTPVIASPSGFLSPDGLRASPSDATVLLSDAMFVEDRTPRAAALVDGHRVLVSSSGASDGGPGPDPRTTQVAMRQRYLAEAAVRYLDTSTGTGATPLIMTLPHDWNPGSSGGSFFSGLDVPWLDATTLDAISRSSAAGTVDATALRYPLWQAESELDETSFEAADRLIRSGAALQSLLTLNNLVGGTVADEALGSTSYSARTRPVASRAAVDRSREWITSRLSEVSVTGPQAVTLSSSSGPFAATVVNGLDQPVTVALDAQTDDELTISGPQRLEIGAGGRRQVILTARTDATGIHEVQLRVTDKRGQPLGASTTVAVRSAQVSNVIWLFMGGGAALLFGAIGVRLFRRIRDARRTPVPGSAEAPPGAGSETARQPAGAGRR